MQIIKENRQSIILMLIALIFLSFITGAFIPSLVEFRHYTGLAFRESVLFFFMISLMSAAFLLAFSSVVYMLIKLIRPSTIIMTEDGLVGAGIKKVIKWEDILSIEYLRREKKYKSIYKSLVSVMSLFLVINPITFICYVLRCALIIEDFETKIICVKTKDNKKFVLNFDESLISENDPSAITQIRVYKQNTTTVHNAK